MVQGQYMKKSFNAVFFALLMATMSLAGCFGGNDNEQIDGNETPVETLTNGRSILRMPSDLPECNENESWLYYASEDQNFRGCTSFGWELSMLLDQRNRWWRRGGRSKRSRRFRRRLHLINAVNSTSCLNGEPPSRSAATTTDGFLAPPKPKSPSTSATVYKDQKVLKGLCRCRWCTGSSRSTRASRCRWNQRNEWSGWRRWG